MLFIKLALCLWEGSWRPESIHFSLKNGPEGQTLFEQPSPTEGSKPEHSLPEVQPARPRRAAALPTQLMPLTAARRSSDGQAPWRGDGAGGEERRPRRGEGGGTKTHRRVLQGSQQRRRRARRRPWRRTTWQRRRRRRAAAQGQHAYQTAGGCRNPGERAAAERWEAAGRSIRLQEEGAARHSNGEAEPRR